MSLPDSDQYNLSLISHRLATIVRSAFQGHSRAMIFISTS